MKTHLVIAGLLFAVAIPAANAQQRQAQQAERKLYCWEESGRRVCGDTLPATAVDSARTEISARSGLRVGEVDRALTPEERAAAQAQAERDRQAAEVLAAQQRREMAMAASYNTEDELRAAFGERIVLIDEALKTSRMSVANQRQSLLSLLRQASNLELDSKPVPKKLSGNISAQHNDLLRQLTIMDQQLNERASLDADLDYALERYRALKKPAGG